MVRGKATKGNPRKSPPTVRHADLKLKVESVMLEMLVPYARNARLHSDDQVKQLAASMAEFGFVVPVVIDENSEIIAGHGRVMAAKSLGLVSAPVVRLTHLSDEQKRALRLADNKIALNSKWDADILAAELNELKAVGNIDGVHLADITGFDAREIRGLTVAEEKDDGDGFGGGTKKGPYDLIVTCKTKALRAKLQKRLEGEGFACEEAA